MTQNCQNLQKSVKSAPSVPFWRRYCAVGEVWQWRPGGGAGVTPYRNLGPYAAFWRFYNAL